MRRVIISFATSLALVVSGGVLAVAPASAVTVVTFANCQTALNGQTINVPSGETNLFVTFASCDVTTPAASSGASQTNPNLILSTSANPPQPGGGNNLSEFNISGQLRLNVSVGSPGSISGSRGIGSGAIVDGVYTVYFGYFTSAPSSYYGSFTIDVGGSGGGGGSSSSSSSSSTPTVETLNVEVSGSDTACTGGNPSASSGSWLTLPSAEDCTQTGPKADPSAKLLGWATDPNFSVEIAKRQVANGWGAYETFNAEGQLTGVFIPAGGATFVSGSNNLYPIWSS